MRFPGRKADALFLLLAFISGAVIRLIPEILAGTNGVLGYDLIAYYAPVLYHKELIFADWRILFAPPNFSPGIYVALLWVPREYIFLALRSLVVVSYGFLSAAIFLFVQTRLKLAPRWAFFTALFVCLQVGTLRIGWDLIKNTVTMSFVLLILSGKFHQNSKSTRLMTIATALVHQLVAILLAVILGFELGLNRNTSNHGASNRRAIASNIIIILVCVVVTIVLPGNTFGLPVSGTVYYVQARSTGSTTQLFVNYLAVYGSYVSVFSRVLLLGALMFAPIIPLAVVGWRRERILSVWALITAAAGLSPLILPTFAAAFWDRWLFLLILPVGIWGACGVKRIVQYVQHVSRMRIAGIGFLILLLIPSFFLAGNFMLLPPEHAYGYFTNPSTLPVFPSSMLQNTVPLSDVRDVENAVATLNQIMTERSVVLVHECFFGWISMGLTGKKAVVDYLLGTPEDGLPIARSQGYTTIYWIWWVPGVNMNGYEASTQIFRAVYVSGRIAVYSYIGS
jgi:hypothetical protein